MAAFLNVLFHLRRAFQSAQCYWLYSWWAVVADVKMLGYPVSVSCDLVKKIGGT